MTDGTALGTRMVLGSPAGLRLFVHSGADRRRRTRFSSSPSGMVNIPRCGGPTVLPKGLIAITPAGTEGELRSDLDSPGPGFLFLCNAEWGGQAGLWRSDGSSSGTTFVAAVGCWQNSIGKRGHDDVSPDGVLYFQGQAASPGPDDPELWRSDGTSAGTWRVKDICPGGNGSWPSGLSWLGSELLFAAERRGGQAGSGAPTAPRPAPCRSRLPTTLYPSFWGEVDGRRRQLLLRRDRSRPRHRALGLRWRHCLADRRSRARPRLVDRRRLSRLLAPLFESFGSEAVFTATDDAFGRRSGEPTDRSGNVRISDIAPGPAALHLPIFWAIHDAVARRQAAAHREPAGDRRAALAARSLRQRDGAGRRPERPDTLVRAPRHRPAIAFRAAARQRLLRGRRRPCSSSDRLSPRAQIDLFRTDGALRRPEPIFARAPAVSTRPRADTRASAALRPGAGPLPAAMRSWWRFDALSDATETAARLRRLAAEPSRRFSTRRRSGLRDGVRALPDRRHGRRHGASGDRSGRLRRAHRPLSRRSGGGGRCTLDHRPARAGRRARPASGRRRRAYVAPELAPLGPTLVFLAWDAGRTAASSGLPTAPRREPRSWSMLVPGPGSLFRGVSIDRYVEYDDAELVGADTFAVLAGRNCVRRRGALGHRRHGARHRPAARHLSRRLSVDAAAVSRAWATASSSRPRTRRTGSSSG